MKRLINLHLIATITALISTTAFAVPHNNPNNLLDCGSISILGGGACNTALQELCDATDIATVGALNQGYDFKKQNDHDTLVSKVVGAALKYDQGKDLRGESKLAEYGTKLNGMNCSPSESKPKIQCTLQTELNTDLITAQGACP